MMSADISVLLVLVILGLVFGIFGGYVASQKNRAVAEGVCLGFCFGPLGCLIEAILPTLTQCRMFQVAEESPDEAKAGAFLDQISPRASKSQVDDLMESLRRTPAENDREERKALRDVFGGTGN